MKCDIFISYRRDGGDMTAMHIYQALRERGYDVFYDLEVLRAGKFNDALLEYIGSCRDFILILSPHALDRCTDESDWVRKEIAEALRLKKNIIPVMMNGFAFPQTLPEDIDDVRYQNGLTSTTEYFMESVNRLCSKYLLSKPKKKTSPVAIGMVCTLTSVIVTAAVCVLLLGGGRGALPVASPTAEPTAAPTAEPTAAPTAEPTAAPTACPTATPVPMAFWPEMRPDNPEEISQESFEHDEHGQPVFSGFPVLGNDAYRREQIASVTFVGTLSGAGEGAWDVSKAGDGSVLAWTVPSGELFDLYIGSEGGVRVMNANSLFGGYQNAKRITFGGYADFSLCDDFMRMFYGCESLIDTDVGTLDVSSARDMDSMFRLCESLTALDLSGWNVSDVRVMRVMFHRCLSLRSLDVSTWDTSRVTDMHGMFAECELLRTLDVSGFNTSRVTSMNSMFTGTPQLRHLDVSGFDTSQVLDMGEMFHYCGVQELDVSGFDTSRAEYMNHMFNCCNGLLELDVSGFDTSRVTRMDWMFGNCTSLVELDVSGFDTSKVISMENMFEQCSALRSLDVSGFNTSNVKNMNEMFRGCVSLETLDVSGWDVQQVRTMEYMFCRCESLTHLDISRWTNGYRASRKGMFAGAWALESVGVEPSQLGVSSLESLKNQPER